MRCGAVDLAGADGFACVLGGLAAGCAAEAKLEKAESCACIQAETKGSIAGPASKNLIRDRGAGKTRMEGAWNKVEAAKADFCEEFDKSKRLD